MFKLNYAPIRVKNLSWRGLFENSQSDDFMSSGSVPQGRQGDCK